MLPAQFGSGQRDAQRDDGAAPRPVGEGHGAPVGAGRLGGGEEAETVVPRPVAGGARGVVGEEALAAVLERGGREARPVVGDLDDEASVGGRAGDLDARAGMLGGVGDEVGRRPRQGDAVQLGALGVADGGVDRGDELEPPRADDRARLVDDSPAQLAGGDPLPCAPFAPCEASMRRRT